MQPCFPVFDCPGASTARLHVWEEVTFSHCVQRTRQLELTSAVPWPLQTEQRPPGVKCICVVSHSEQLRFSGTNLENFSLMPHLFLLCVTQTEWDLIWWWCSGQVYVAEWTGSKRRHDVWSTWKKPISFVWFRTASLLTLSNRFRFYWSKHTNNTQGKCTASSAFKYSFKIGKTV